MVTSGGHGHVLQHSIALACVQTALSEPETTLEVEILGERYPATVGRAPLYDPENQRLRS